MNFTLYIQNYIAFLHWFPFTLNIMHFRELSLLAAFVIFAATTRRLCILLIEIALPLTYRPTETYPCFTPLRYWGGKAIIFYPIFLQFFVSFFFLLKFNSSTFSLEIANPSQ